MKISVFGSQHIWKSQYSQYSELHYLEDPSGGLLSNHHSHLRCSPHSSHKSQAQLLAPNTVVW